MGVAIQEKLLGVGAQEAGGGRPGLKDLLEAYERSLIVDALTACGGHQRRTAARLGILPTTLHEKMKRLGLLRRRQAEADLMPARDFAYSVVSAAGRGDALS
jgi:DNA-binding NtrC family response regulator